MTREFVLRARDFTISLSEKQQIMGVINITPDSFYDGGMLYKNGIVDEDKVLAVITNMVREGADMIDIGGESTRPGAVPVDANEEMKRVIGVIQKASKLINIPISIDTYKKEVAEASLQHGASIVNDISGFLYDNHIAATSAKYEAAVVLMHTKQMPHEMKWSYEDATTYTDVVQEVMAQLKHSINIAQRHNIQNIIIDVGFGFGKSVEGNFELLRRLNEFQSMGYPMLVGVSRKSFIGKAISHDTIAAPSERLYGTIVANTIALMNGANIIRVHDIKAAKDTIRMISHLKK